MAGLLMQPLSFVLSCFICEFIIAFFIPTSRNPAEFFLRIRHPAFAG